MCERCECAKQHTCIVIFAQQRATRLANTLFGLQPNFLSCNKCCRSLPTTDWVTHPLLSSHADVQESCVMAASKVLHSTIGPVLPTLYSLLYNHIALLLFCGSIVLSVGFGWFLDSLGEFWTNVLVDWLPSFNNIELAFGSLFFTVMGFEELGMGRSVHGLCSGYFSSLLGFWYSSSEHTVVVSSTVGSVIRHFFAYAMYVIVV